MTAPDYPRPDMAAASGARADGPELDLRGPSRVEQDAAAPGSHASRGDAMFWDAIAQSHRRLGRGR